MQDILQTPEPDHASQTESHPSSVDLVQSRAALDQVLAASHVRHKQDVPDPEEAAVLVLRVAYDGTDFSGFAAQSPDQGVRTVAGELSRGLATLLHREVPLVCAGRTDAGVHARSQFVSISLRADEALALKKQEARRLVRSLGAILPDDIVVKQAFRADPGFSARFDAISRIYRYRIVRSEVRPLFCARWAWWVRGTEALDEESMARAAAALIGEHDFASFCKTTSAQGKSTHRMLAAVDLFHEEQLGEDQLVIQVEGNAFLHNMVRSIVGTLVDVGVGRRPASWVSQVLEARDRRAAGPTAPAAGLTFWDVRYPEGSLRTW